MMGLVGESEFIVSYDEWLPQEATAFKRVTEDFMDTTRYVRGEKAAGRWRKGAG